MLSRPRFGRIRLTLLGKAIALVAAELLANAAVWTAAGICLSSADGLLGLAMLAWTLGLRHGLDADHISAIDNATRQMVSLGRLPLTCGLWFSLGHSTIVIAVNIAIAVSVDIYDRLGKVGSIGGIVGTSVSASFLFLVACINTVFLVGAIRERRRRKAREAAGLEPLDVDPTKVHGGGCLVRIVGPILRAVDRPWKLYPVGVLFGFGFDTASSIALLAISAIATRGPHGEAISHGKVVILPFLFTAGMSLVDSLDSILMLYAYAQPALRGPDGRFALFTRGGEASERVGLVSGHDRAGADTSDVEAGSVASLPSHPAGSEAGLHTPQALGKIPDTTDMAKVAHPGVVPVDPEAEERDERARRILEAKTSTMSSLSISLTLLSILVALRYVAIDVSSDLTLRELLLPMTSFWLEFRLSHLALTPSISLIEIMGLVGENCARCTAAAEAEDGGGLAGSWWRAWARANDASGYVGAAIVGCFVAILAGYHAGRYGWRRWGKGKAKGKRGRGADEVGGGGAPLEV